MSFGGAWKAIASLMTRTLGSTAAHPDRGETVILRRPSPRFEDTAQRVTPREMRLAAAALAGATSVVLELPSGGGLAGTLQAGAHLTIGGEEYTVAADAQAAGTTLAVTLTTGLEADAAGETPVTVQPEAVFTFLGCQVARRRHVENRPLQGDHFAVVTVPCEGAPATPRMNDMVELEDGKTGRVSNQVLGGGAFWKLNIGA